MIIKRYWKTGLFSVFFIIGLVLILNCINYGEINISQIMKQHGGSMPTDTYLIFLQQAINKYKVLGIVMSSFGGLGLILDLVICKNRYLKSS